MTVEQVAGACGGSSPRGRGTRRSPAGSLRRFRFIPAWAGNTYYPCWPRPSHPVHPRVGGEHERAHRRNNIYVGSSPRGRGTPDAGVTNSPESRFIPAWAGNTATTTSAQPRAPVHPRVGGEHASRPSLTLTSNGSSPRGRGTLIQQVPGGEMGRFIPAWAGNTRSPLRDQNGRRQRRFIPAWAGNTNMRLQRHSMQPVHPRVGGERHSMSWILIVRCGSSPRGRGTR